MLFSFFAVFLMIVLNLAIPICIAVYVYQDAKRRGMEPILWALVAAIVPWFIGLIIYLLVRSGHSALRCVKCGASVEEHYTVCPQCGAELKSRCPSCDRFVQPDWHLCAYCSAELPAGRSAAVVEQPANNKGLWIVLGIIAAMLVLMLLFVLIANVSFA